MNLPHALTIHGLQVLPVLGRLLLFTRWDERGRTAPVLWTAVGSAAIIGASIAQAAGGRAPLDPSAGTGAPAVAGILTVTVAEFLAAAGLDGSRVEIAEGSHRRAAGG